MDQLRVALRVSPVHSPPRLDDRQIGRQEGPADILGQGKIGLPVAAVAVIHEDPADAARAPAMGNEEILVCPGLQLGIKRLAMRGQVARLHGVEMLGILGIFDAGVQVGPAAEPPGMRGPEHPRIHVDGGTVRVLHMRHQADPRGPEARIAFHPRHAARGHRLLRRRAQVAIDGGDIDADLLEHPAPAHHAHHAATRVRSVLGGAACLRHLESPGGLLMSRTSFIPGHRVPQRSALVQCRKAQM